MRPVLLSVIGILAAWAFSFNSSAHAQQLLDLSSWEPETADVSANPSGVWVLAPDNLSVEHTANADPTFFVSSLDSADRVLSMTVTAEIFNDDDDWFGFVVGFEPGSTENPAAEFLLVDWKRNPQTNSFTCGGAVPSLRGLAASRIFGTPEDAEYFGHVTLTDACSDPSSGVVELQRGLTLGDSPWDFGIPYVFEIGFTETSLQVFVDGVLEIDVAGNFEDGRFGFHNQSQPVVTYSASDLTIGQNADFTEALEIASPANDAHDVASADIDLDGDLDILTVSGADDTLAWHENDGSVPPSFTEHVISNTVDNPQSVFAVDLNGDGEGRIDILVASVGDNSVRAFANQGGSPPVFVELLLTSNADGAYAVFGADLDEDGDTDVIAGSRADDTVRWFENDGGQPPVFTERIITTSADSVRSVFAVDINGDGDVDVLAASQEDDTLSWFENNGATPPGFFEREISTTVDGARSIYAADMNGDGRPDILSASLLDDSIRIFANNGGQNPSFAEQIVSSQVLGALSVSASDLDLDGDADILAASRDDNNLRWFESDGGSPPSFTEHVIANDATLAQSITAADLDGDSDPDIVAATLQAYKAAWYENCGGQFTLAATDTAPSELLGGAVDDLLAIEVIHRGTVGDLDLALTRLEFLFEAGPGTPLTTEEANDLIDSLEIYLDDGSGVFEPEFDLLVERELFLPLEDGFYTTSLAAGNPDFEVSAAESVVYFLAVELTPDAAEQTPNSFRVTHLTQPGGPQGGASHSGFNVPLRLECSTDVPSSTVTAIAPPPTLEISGSCPGETSLTVTGALPNASLTFVSAEAEGMFVKPQPPCQGLELGLDAPSLVTSLTADDQGNLSVAPVLSDAVCGKFIQAVEVGRCSVSNVAQLP